MENLRILSPIELKQVGKAVFGVHVKESLAEHLKVDSRRVDQWLVGRRPAPAGISLEILERAYKVKEIMANAKAELDAKLRNSEEELVRLTATELEGFGEMFYGIPCKNTLAKKLNVFRSTMGNWLDGDVDIPVPVTKEVFDLAVGRITELDAAIDFLEGMRSELADKKI